MEEYVKRLKDFPILDSEKDNFYVLIDDDGVSKKIPLSKIKSLLTKAPGLVFDTLEEMQTHISEHPDELVIGQDLFIRDEDVPDYWWDGTQAVPVDSGVSSWNDLEDKPFGIDSEPIYIVSPINIQFTDGSGDTSPEVDSVDFTVGSTLYVVWDGITYEQTVKSGMYNFIGDDTVPFRMHVDGDGYLIIKETSGYTGTINVALARSLGTVKTLDEKYIPDSIARKDLSITSAAVGQTIKITEVDENGKPTKWEAVDMESGGTSDAVQYIPQELTEEQKMQSRKNQGLYYKEFKPRTLMYVTDPYNTSKIYDFAFGYGSVFKVQIFGLVSEFVEEYTVESYHEYDYGSDITSYHIGGSEYPFHIERIGRETRLVSFDASKLINQDIYGIYELAVVSTTDMDVTYSPVSEEYIPETIARKTDIPDGIDSAVMYTAQNKTENEQMQARVNLGLYWKEYVNKVLASIKTEYRKTDISDGEDIFTASVATMKYSDWETEGAEYQLERQSSQNSNMAGTFHHVRWFGNGNLIKNDTDLYETVAEIEETKYTDVPFVLYEYNSDFTSFGRVYRLYIDDAKPSFPLTLGVYLDIIDTENFDEVYHPVPDEYIPDTIARKTDIPKAGATSWNDLTDKPFESGLAEVDIIPEQQVTFSEGNANVTGYKDPCYDLGIVSDPGTTPAFLVVNGEIIEGEINYYYAVEGTFGSYSLGYGSLSLLEGASVQDGETVTIRLYAISEIVKPLDAKYLPETDVVLTKQQQLTEDQQRWARSNINAIGFGERFRRYELFGNIGVTLNESNTVWGETITFPENVYDYRELVVEAHVYVKTSTGGTAECDISVTLRNVSDTVSVHMDRAVYTTDGLAILTVDVQSGEIEVSIVRPSGQDNYVDVHLTNIYGYVY